MTRRSKLGATVVAIVAVAVGVMGLVLSHDAGCPRVGSAPTPTAPMRAALHRCYGQPDVITIETVERPAIGDSDVLVKVHAASLNPLDWHYLHGSPYLMRFGAGFGKPNDPRIGVDFAGTVEAVGSSVTGFRPGDQVYGGRTGAAAEYVAVRESRAIVPKPANLSFEQAAAIPIAAVTALQALRDQAHLRSGQTVLINGASGGVGTFAVQLAKAMGGTVTAVCSGRNAALVRSIGADRVIDYGAEDFTRGTERYDVILDNVGNHSLSELRRVLAPNGTAVLVGGGGPNDGHWIGPLMTPIKAVLFAPFVRQRLTMFIAKLNPADLRTVNELVEAGRLTPMIDRRYDLSHTSEAIRYLEAGHARGKVVLTIP